MAINKLNDISLKLKPYQIEAIKTIRKGWLYMQTVVIIPKKYIGKHVEK